MRLILVLALFAAAPALAQPPDSTRALTHADTPKIHALQTSEHIKVDGKLDEAAWDKAERVDRFTQRDPEEGKPVSERTEDAQSRAARDVREGASTGPSDFVEEFHLLAFRRDIEHAHRTAQVGNL